MILNDISQHFVILMIERNLENAFKIVKDTQKSALKLLFWNCEFFSQKLYFKCWQGSKLKMSKAVEKPNYIVVGLQIKFKVNFLSKKEVCF